MEENQETPDDHTDNSRGLEMSDNVKEIIGSVFSTAVKIVLAMLVVMFVRKYALMAYNYGYRVFTEPPVTVTGDGTSIDVSIGEGISTREIGKMLESKGLIRDANLFLIQELVSANHGKIQPGKYQLSTTMTADEMIDVMAGAEKKPETEEELLYNADEEKLPFDNEGDEPVEEYIPEEELEDADLEGEGEE